MGYPSLIGGAIGKPRSSERGFFMRFDGLSQRWAIAERSRQRSGWIGHRLIQSRAGRFELLFSLNQNSLLTNLAGNFSDEGQPKIRGKNIKTLGKYLTEAH